MAATNLSELAEMMACLAKVNTEKSKNKHIAIVIFFSAVLSRFLLFMGFDWKKDS